MYTIFKNDVSIILTDDRNSIGTKPYLLWKEIQQKKVLDQLLSFGQRNIFVYHEDLAGMWTDFKNNFKVIEASGGIVKNNFDQLLFIFRQDKWDLPKGKIEKGETRKDAALREVSEECGFKTSSLGNDIATTYHLYTEDKDEVLKISYWYEMFSSETELTPQTEEGITALKWVNKDELNLVLDDTYPNICALVDTYLLAHQ